MYLNIPYTFCFVLFLISNMFPSLYCFTKLPRLSWPFAFPMNFTISLLSTPSLNTHNPVVIFIKNLLNFWIKVVRFKVIMLLSVVIHKQI